MCFSTREKGERLCSNMTGAKHGVSAGNEGTACHCPEVLKDIQGWKNNATVH